MIASFTEFGCPMTADIYSSVNTISFRRNMTFLSILIEMFGFYKIAAINWRPD
jgi:hypothetical protein